MFLIESLKPGLCVLLSLTSIWFPSGDAAGVLLRGRFGSAVCLGWAGVDAFRRETEGSSGCTCCSPWLLFVGVSTCSHGCCVAVCVDSRGNRETIHTRSDGYLQPLSLNACSLCKLSAPSFQFLSCAILWISLCSQCTRLLSATLYPLYPQSLCLPVLLSLPHFLRLLLLKFFLFVFPTSLSAFQRTQEHKHKQQQLGALIVLLWNSMALSVKDEVVKNKLNITTKSLQQELGQQRVSI